MKTITTLAILAISYHGYCQEQNHGQTAIPDLNAGMQNKQVSEHAVLHQNTPNPFEDKTVIAYLIPQNIVQAEIVFYNSEGQVMKRLPIQARGAGDLTINGARLNRGTYTYSIIADGKISDTKQMTHQ